MNTDYKKNSLVYWTIYAVSITATLLIVKFTHSCDCLNKFFFHDLKTHSLVTETAKWMLLRSLLAKIALYLFLHAIIVMAIRIFSGKSSPATVEDPTPIKVINRIITNTLEQTVMFVGLYAYFIFDRSEHRFSKDEIVSFGSWFLLARVAFSATYLLGYLVGYPNLRAFGVALNVAAMVLLIQIDFSPVAPLTHLFLGK